MYGGRDILFVSLINSPRSLAKRETTLISIVYPLQFEYFIRRIRFNINGIYLVIVAEMVLMEINSVSSRVEQPAA